MAQFDCYARWRAICSGSSGRHGGILWPKQLKLLHDRIDEFAKDVAIALIDPLQKGLRIA